MINGVNCPRCNKYFKYQCYLNKHLKNKSICRDIDEKSTETTYKGIIYTDIDTRTTENDEKVDELAMKTSLIVCKYCEQRFKSNKNLNRHMDTCKLKNDNVRIYEVELGINLSIMIY